MSGLGEGSMLCSGRYRLETVVGRGGMAAVWRATDVQLERVVAIKIISDVLAGDPSFVARFEREARLAASLNHPNLVKVFDFSTEEERPLLVMEYVAGGTLADARGQELDVDALARELLDAVAHIHATGILHRDIKPANVLLGTDGSPRLTDFGIARGEETTALTQPGQVLGTLRYIAPEVAAGEPATARSDLYSLGVLLTEVGGSPPEALSALLARMTAKDPAQRPTSAAEALSELEPTRALAEGQTPPPDAAPTQALPGVAGTAGGQTPLRAALDRPRLARSHALAAAAVLVAVLVLVIVAATGGDDDPKLEAPQTTQLQPARAGAPVDEQLDRLEAIVRAAPRKP